MNAYNDDRKEIIYNENNIFDFGNCSEIYKINKEECLKIYYDSCILKNRINKDIYKVLNELNLLNLVELKSLLYSDKKLSTVKGYIMKYYQSKQFKILKEPVNFSINNIKSIHQLFNSLAQNNIIVDDVKRENVVFDGKKMIIIDPDKFYICNKSIDYCIQKNYESLLCLFKNIYLKESFSFLKSNSYNPYEQLDFLFSKNESIDLVYKKLEQYEYPIQYFK